MALTYLKGFFFFLSSIDNLGLVSQIAILILGIISFSRYIRNDLLGLVYLPTLILFFSIGCLSIYINTLIFFMIKAFVVIFLLSKSSYVLYKVFLTSFALHIFSGFLVFIILLSPIKDAFIEFVPYELSAFDKGLVGIRPVGFFDEPSTYGYALLLHLFSMYLLNSKGFRSFFAFLPFLTFSAPVQLLSAFGVFISKKNLRFGFLVLLLSPILFYIVYSQVIIREDSYKLSPISLRANHYIEFSKNPTFYAGNGLCSAYGKYDLNMGKAELRQQYLSNFKDAGQLIFTADRIGVIWLSLLLFFLYRKLGLNLFIVFITIFAFAKIPVYSFIMFSVLGTVLRHDKNN